MPRNLPLLFSDEGLSAVLRDRDASLAKIVEEIPREQFAATSEEMIVEHVVGRMRIEPFELFEERAEMEERETKIDVTGDPMRGRFGGGPIYTPGIEVRVTIPFRGPPELLRFTPSHRMMRYPHAEINQPRHGLAGSIVVIVSQPCDMPPGELKPRLDSELECLRFFFKSAASELTDYNNSLPQKIRQLVDARKKRLTVHASVQQILGIPLKRKHGAPSLEPIKLERSLVRPLPEVAAKPPARPEYGISDKDYEFILNVIRHESRTFETTPATYHKLHEEELRNVLLAHLNGHFVGAATGEAFRRSGKTDIKIEFENRAAFVAECKVWGGAKELGEAVGQLLSYLTWRDSKAALVIFNKDVATFTDVIATAPKVLEGHANYRSRLSARPEQGEWRFTMASLEDPSRLVTVHLFLVNIYASYVGRGKVRAAKGTASGG